MTPTTMVVKVEEASDHRLILLVHTPRGVARSLVATGVSAGVTMAPWLCKTFVGVENADDMCVMNVGDGKSKATFESEMANWL